VRRVVLHPSSFVEWFNREVRSPLRTEFEAGGLEVIVPPTFVAEALEQMAATGMPSENLARLADDIRSLGFRVVEPPISELARHLARGLSASDGTYAALAVWLEAPLAVSDRRLLAATPNLPHESA
jgi:predicted nucleic acid-binding protein